MYFNQMMFNPQYVTPSYYQQMQAQTIQYNVQQDQEVYHAVKAMRDLCQAAKKMDEEHQQKAFLACLSVIAEEYGWEQSIRERR